MLNKLPISKKLALIILLSNGILLGAVFVVTGLWNVNTIRDASKKTAESAIQVFSQDFTKIIVFDNPRVAADTVSRLQAIEPIRNVILFNADNRPVFSYNANEDTKINTPSVLPPQTFFKQGFLHVYADVVYEGMQHGTVYYRMSTSILDSALANYSVSLGTFIVLIILVSIFVSSKLQKIISTPIIELAKVANYVLNNNDLTRRAHTDEKNEIGQLYNDFNLMIEGISHRNEILENKNIELEAHRNKLELLVDERTREINEYVKELETFSYTVSHDLRTPLRAINGFGSILMDSYADRLDEEGRQLLQRLIASSNRMGELIDDILMLSKVNQSKISKEHFNLALLVKDIVDDYEKSGHTYGKIELRVQPEIPIFADPKLMRVVLDNLVSNSIKYRSKNENLVLEIGANRDENSTVVFVKDNGIGFDMQYHDKLFAPFQRLHSDAEYEGTGIGLATVKRIMQRQSGEIWATSAKHHGATFFMQLPHEIELE